MRTSRPSSSRICSSAIASPYPRPGPDDRRGRERHALDAASGKPELQQARLGGWPGAGRPDEVAEAVRDDLVRRGPDDRLQDVRVGADDRVGTRGQGDPREVALALRRTSVTFDAPVEGRD